MPSPVRHVFPPPPPRSPPSSAITGSVQRFSSIPLGTAECVHRGGRAHSKRSLSFVVSEQSRKMRATIYRLCAPSHAREDGWGKATRRAYRPRLCGTPDSLHAAPTTETTGAAANRSSAGNQSLWRLLICQGRRRPERNKAATSASRAFDSAEVGAPG